MEPKETRKEAKLRKTQERITERLEGMFNLKSTETDPFGSYTGVPINPDEEPVQDADDL